MRSLSSQATSSSPGIGGSVARVPTFRKTSGAASVPPPTAISKPAPGPPVKRASPYSRASPSVSSSESANPFDPAVDERVLAGHHRGEVDRHLTGRTPCRPRLRQMGASRRPQGLRRTASPVEARAADLVLLDDGHSLAP